MFLKSFGMSPYFVVRYFANVVELRWLSTQFLAINTNFRLKLKDCGLRNVELSPGWSYYVEDKKYSKFIMLRYAKLGYDDLDVSW